MHLARIRVANFRNLLDLTVDLKAGLNVIVGENNVGKTNLLDAIRVALGAASTGGDAVYLTKEDRHRSRDGQFTDAPIRVSLTFENLSPDEQAEFLDALNYDENDPASSTATINYEWVYSPVRDRWNYKRWGSERTNNEGTLSDYVLQALPVTYLGALRDAERALAPGRHSRLARLLSTTATEDDRNEVSEIGVSTNQALQQTDLVKRAERQIAEILETASGTDLMRGTSIRATPTDFERLVQALRILLRPAGNSAAADELLDELASNGLGYNNLIYMATVLAELASQKDAALPLLLVEEPEAHLHPQLQTLLCSHLAKQRSRVQTIVTTHSPTVAAHVRPFQLAVMHRTRESGLRVTRVDGCGLNEPQEKQLRRVLDVTRASLLFAQGVVLVEGISEAVLLPALARRIGIDFGQHAVSVVTMGGVDFGSVSRLFGDDKIQIPVSIVTDADPTIVDTADWREAKPERDPDTGSPTRSERAKKVETDFGSERNVLVAISELTLEYDLAVAGPENALAIFDSWAYLYTRSPRSVTRDEIESQASADEKALLLWRAICRGSPLHGKAQLAQELARRLDEQTAVEFPFVVPAYLERAIRHAARVPVE